MNLIPGILYSDSAISPDVLLEGCNALVTGGGYFYNGSEINNWQSFNKQVGGAFPVADATFKTEGFSAWKFTSFNLGGSTNINAWGSPDVTGLNLSGYTKISIDYNVVSIGAGDYLVLMASSGGGADKVYTSVLNPSGSGTLLLDITPITDKSAVNMTMLVCDNADGSGNIASAASLFHVDNLRKKL